MGAGLMLVAALVGCGGDETPAAADRFDADLPDELRCDIATEACQNLVYDSVAATLGAEEFDRPSIRTISVDQHADEVRAGLDLGDLTGEDAETRGLRALGFIPPASESVAGTQAEYFITQIAAYYSRGSRTITVVDRDYDDIDAQVLLAHEFIHAIQDNQFGLNSVTSGVNTEDGVMGARGVIEGDAVYSSFAWAYDKLEYGPDDVDWDEIHAGSTERARDRAADPEVALIDSASSFPYSYGLAFMTKATQAGGLPGRAEQFESPPATALEVMLGFGADVPALDFPPAAPESPVGEHALEYENRFGAWYVYGLLRRGGMSDNAAWMAALSARGDNVAIYDDGSEVVAVWRVRFNHPLTASILRDGVNVEGDALTREAVLADNEVFVFAAETEDTLLAWAGQPPDLWTASIVSKDAPRWGGAVSVGNCIQSRHFSLPRP